MIGAIAFKCFITHSTPHSIHKYMQLTSNPCTGAEVTAEVNCGHPNQNRSECLHKAPQRPFAEYYRRFARHISGPRTVHSSTVSFCVVLRLFTSVNNRFSKMKRDSYRDGKLRETRRLHTPSL